MHIRRSLATLLMLVAALAAASSPVFAQAASKVDVTGKWLFTVTTSAGTGTPTLTLTQKGDSLSGHYSSQVLGEADVKGSVSGQKITLNVNVEVQGNAITVTYDGTIDGPDAMKGTVDLGGQANGTFTAKRQ